MFWLQENKRTGLWCFKILKTINPVHDIFQNFFLRERLYSRIFNIVYFQYSSTYTDNSIYGYSGTFSTVKEFQPEDKLQIKFHKEVEFILIGMSLIVYSREKWIK